MNAYEEANELHKKARSFIISCIDKNGFPHTKAVVPGKFRESMKEMYFCTNTSSVFAGAVQSNPKASVYFYTQKLVWKGILLNGNIEIVTDMALKEKYWKEKFKNAYKEKSFTDPDFCLLKFTPIKGRMYAFYKPEDFEIE